MGGIDPFRAAVNTISIPPGEYGRKDRLGELWVPICSSAMFDPQVMLDMGDREAAAAMERYDAAFRRLCVLSVWLLYYCFISSTILPIICSN